LAAVEGLASSGGTPFRVVAEQDGGTSYLRLEGEFDLACIEDFRKQVLEATAQQPSGVVVDLSDLEFIDSSGLRMLVEAEELCRDSGIDYGVRVGAGQARRVFELTGMAEVLPVVD
jgi:anti-anti-sigma factor